THHASRITHHASRITFGDRMDDSARISALQIRVTELEQKLNFVLDQLKLQYAPPPASPAVAEATKWLRQGNKIEAVKVYQQLSGKGLREAKEFVDGLALQLGMSLQPLDTHGQNRRRAASRLGFPVRRGGYALRARRPPGCHTALRRYFRRRLSGARPDGAAGH